MEPKLLIINTTSGISQNFQQPLDFIRGIPTEVQIVILNFLKDEDFRNLHLSKNINFKMSCTTSVWVPTGTASLITPLKVPKDTTMGTKPRQLSADRHDNVFGYSVIFLNSWIYIFAFVIEQTGKNMAVPIVTRLRRGFVPIVCAFGHLPMG